MEMKNHKRAAMEMSVGTIVTIVLLMTVLIMGLVLTRTIFKSSVENINGIDHFHCKPHIQILPHGVNSNTSFIYTPQQIATAYNISAIQNN